MLKTLSNQEKIKSESACYHYCIDTAFALVEAKEFGKAAIYYENAARSLRVLEKYVNSEESLFKILGDIDNADKQEINNWMKELRKTT